jgi:hypothetical protein
MPAMSLGLQGPAMEFESQRRRDDEQLTSVRRVDGDASDAGAAGTAAWCTWQLRILGAACMKRA